MGFGQVLVVGVALGSTSCVGLFGVWRGDSGARGERMRAYELTVMCKGCTTEELYVGAPSSCSSTSPANLHPAVFDRTSFGQWETVRRADLDLSFEKPSGLRTLGSSTSVLIQLHGVRARSVFPSDTQYLVVIAIEKYSKEQWQAEQAFQMRINRKVKDEKWLDFRQWAYSSLSPEVSMRERDAVRYYRRTITNEHGAVVTVSTEYIPKVPSTIAEDDAAIRRIMSSVAFIAEKKAGSGPSAGPKAVPREEKQGE
jgi:hypothetical protein